MAIYGITRFDVVAFMEQLQEASIQIGIGRFNGANTLYPHLFDQTVLEQATLSRDTVFGLGE